MKDLFNDLQPPVAISLDRLDPNDGQLQEQGLPGNPRDIKDEKYELLKENIKKYPEFLRQNSLIVYPYANDRFIIIGGNMRYHALKELGFDNVPCSVLPADTPIERLKAFVVLDNSSFGKWDWDKIANEWDADELTGWGVDLPIWEENPDIEADVEGATALDDIVEDEVEENDIAKRCKFGDIWLLGSHKLMCGDSTDVASIKLLFEDSKADLLLTDPPYNVDYKGGTKDELKISNDNMEDSQFLVFLSSAFKSADFVLKDGASFYIWHADSEGLNFRKAVKEAGWLLKQVLIWNKNQMVLGRQDYQWKHKPCLYGWKSGASHRWFSDRSQTTVIDFKKPLANKEHPTMKPVGLFAYLVNNSSKAGDLIFDPFGGSGTSIIACEQLGRVCYSMELDPHYCDVILARYEKTTGNKVVKIK